MPSNILLRDILISAREESIQMRHFYLGVEHLFIALLEILGGLASSILKDQGLTADYVADAIRRKIGRGTPERLWVGIPYTPRTEIILDAARDAALDTGSDDIGERELLNAIIAERDSLPMRVLKSLGVNFDTLAQAARTHSLSDAPQPPNITVVFGEDFDRDFAVDREQLFILRRMFPNHARIRVDRRLTGFRSALILVVTPIDSDGREDAPVVAKIDRADSILDEVQRYEAHVKSALPLQTARLEDPPTAPEASELAGIKYTLVAGSGSVPQDLRCRVHDSGVDGLGELIQQELYARFSKTWWQQRRPFRFQVWTEYDWILPPILTLDLTDLIEPPPNSHVLKIPFNRARLKTKLKEMQFGDYVVLENFTVQRVDRDANVLKLAIGYGIEADKRAYKVEVRGINALPKSAFYRGDVIERLIGTVWKTRHELLMDAALELKPDFDLRASSIWLDQQELANPLYAYEDLLDRYVNGSLSKVHGDLHLGNILVGPNNSTWLIDFAHTRDGHALFDWANLEVSLLGDAVMPAVGDDWDTVRQVLRLLAAERRSAPVESDGLARVMAPVSAIREIAGDCLTVKNRWLEYDTALALCALRAITWNTMPLGGRRLMFLLAGWAIARLNQALASGTSSETPAPDDITENLPGSVPVEAGLELPEEPPQAESSVRDFDLPLRPIVTRRFDEGQDSAPPDA